MSAPLISICIPTYNRVNCLKQNLESIVLQFKDNEVKELIEIVISDNASTDNTKNLVESFQEKFENIKYFRNENNIGFDKNLLNVIEKSSGEYCLTIGDDDAFFDDSLLFLIKKIKDIKASYFMMNCWGYDHLLEKPVVSHPNQLIKEDIIYENLGDFVKSIKNYLNLVGFFGGMSTQLFLRQAWIDFDKKEDYIGTNTIHLFIILSIFQKSKFVLLAKPTIKTRNDNLRWSSYVGLETALKRAKKTISSIYWIDNLYNLNISHFRVKLYFLLRSFYLGFKDLAKNILKMIKLKK